MGENQGMVWIILGVIIVGVVVLALGKQMESNVEGTTKQIESETSAIS